MAVDDSFKKPGAVPFKWEVKPGVPKLQQQQKQPQLQRSPSPLSCNNNSNHNHRYSSTGPPQKLRPPPSRSVFLPPPEPRTRSFRSASRTRSDRWQFDQPLLFRPEIVSVGCFPSPLLGRKGSNSSSKRESRRTGPAPEPGDYASDLETLSRWSVSSRKSLVSPFLESPSSSSRSSYQSSPRPVSDADWAGFGLF